MSFQKEFQGKLAPKFLFLLPSRSMPRILFKAHGLSPSSSLFQNTEGESRFKELINEMVQILRCGVLHIMHENYRNLKVFMAYFPMASGVSGLLFFGSESPDIAFQSISTTPWESSVFCASSMFFQLMEPPGNLKTWVSNPSPRCPRKDVLVFSYSSRIRSALADLPG